MAATLATPDALAQQWVSTEGPYSGEVTAVAATPEGTLIAGTAGKGLFYRRALDSDWTRSLATAFDGITIYSIVAHGDHLVAATNGKGIWRSADGGENWGNLSAGLGSLIVRALFVASDARLYAGVLSGLYRLNGSGEWVEQRGGIEGHDIRAIAENSEGTLFAGSFGRGVMRSGDGGLSWNLQTEGLATTIIRSMAVNAGDEVFVGTFGGDVVQRSDDGGSTWVASNEGLAPTSIWAISIAPDGTFFVGSQREGIYTSTDGRTWEHAPAPITTVSGFAFSAGSVYAATRVGLLASSPAGQDWTLAGIPFSRVNSLHEKNGRVFAGLELGGVHYSDDGSGTWQSSELNNEAVVRFADDSDGNLLAATFLSGLFKSSDAGISWQHAWETPRALYSVVVDATGAIVTGTDSGVYRMAAGDTTFRPAGLAGTAIRSVLVTPNGVMLAGSEYRSVWRSTNGGQEWTQTAVQLIGDLWIWDLIALPDGRVAAATTGLGVWTSSDDGVNWEPLPGTGDVVIADLSLTRGGELIAVGLLGQVFLLEKGADHAVTFGPPFLSSPVRAVAALSDGTVLIGTEPLGVRRLDGLRIVALEGGSEMPTAARLDVYPNPTVRSSSIRVRYEHPGSVRWELTDVLGRGLDSGQFNGSNVEHASFEVDTSRLSPGLYWMRVRSAETEGVRSVVVVP